MEVALFGFVAFVAVLAAALMLVSEQPVHSALFLIVNFACVAFFYLMLEAPFLAMVQIAVYAGAIMVLFVFVIMLLGAEKLMEPARQFRWLGPLAVVLTVAFMGTIWLGISSGQIDLQSPVQRAPYLRFVHAAANVGPVDVYTDEGNLLASDLRFGNASSFEAVAGGTFPIIVKEAGSETELLRQEVTLAGDPELRVTAFNVIAWGTDTVNVTVQPENLETTAARTGRFTVFNALPESDISLIDIGSEFATDDTRVLIPLIQAGQFVEIPAVAEDTDLRSWQIIRPTEEDLPLTTLNNQDVYGIERDTSKLIVVAEQATTGTATGYRTVALPLVTAAAAQFGGPHSIGELLFTTYMLPMQLVAMLLLAAMVGAIVLTHKEGVPARRRDVRRVVAKPLGTAIGAQVGADVGGTDEQRRLPDAVGD
jgi:NADH:ubiquinone oxidoreductase subunit 6 (subunit J)